MKLQKALRDMGPIGLLTCVCALLAHAAQAVPTAPLGVVVSSQHALVGSAYIADGSSVFDGDTISTQENGSLRIRVGETTLAISANSTLTLRRDRQAICAVLISGKAQFSIDAGSRVVMDALGATISARQVSASGVIAVVNANEFQISATHGSLDVDVFGDIRVVEEGKSYDATFGAAADEQMPVATAKRRKLLTWLLVFGVAAPTSISVYRATLSPSHPHM